MIAPEQLAKHILGFNTIDCEVRDRTTMYLLARRDYTQDPAWSESKDPPPEGRLQKRALSLRPDNPPEKAWGVARLDGLDLSMCGMAFAPTTSLVVMDINSKAWAHSADTNGFEAPIPSKHRGGILGGAVTRVRSFGGNVLCCSTG